MRSLCLYKSTAPLTRRKENFEPINPEKVGMYVCGPTVYDDCHVGHIVGPMVFDAIARWLKAKGYGVHFVNNITDIDDKDHSASSTYWRALVGYNQAIHAAIF